MRAEALLQRLKEIERTLSVQEWWLLGRDLPEARLLAEVSSLLAVARAEIEAPLIQVFGYDLARGDTTDQFANVEDTPRRSSDPQWLAQCRDQALGLLRMIALALPPMLHYAQLLGEYSARAGLPALATDAFDIVSDRLNEIGEALRVPPR
ncbi:MAG: hypothetical protein ACHQ4H_07735 [Ktedonobacterales bacterium]